MNNNGGTAVKTDFTLSAAGPTPLSGPGGATGLVNAGTYTLSETNVAGYSASAWVCSGSGTQNGSQITLANGQSATCTITNDDIAPSLKLRKVVKNDNGGTKTVADFTLTADGTGANDLSGTSPVDSGPTLRADTFTLSESNVPGYSASAWVCTGSGTQSGSRITLANGQSAVCTITNDDIAPSLKLRKVVNNDNGGTKTVADFTLTADGTGANDLSGTSPVDSDGTLRADTFTLSESNVPGYSASAWVCTGSGTQSGSRITLANGQSATCTITNADLPASLTLDKVVVNDNGGTAVKTDFTLSAAGPTPLSGPGGATGLVNAGTYTLSETNVAGYSASAWVCSGSGTQNGSQITLANGQSATCTITNDDIAPRLLLQKVVDGGGATPGEFTLTATGEGDVPNYTGSGDATASQPLRAGVEYTLGESGPAGYDGEMWVCAVNVDTPQEALAADAFAPVPNGRLTLAPGDDVICQVTNRFRDLAVVKTTDRASYAPGETIDYTVTVENTGRSSVPLAEITVVDPQVTLTLDAAASTNATAEFLAPGEKLVFRGSRAVTVAMCGTPVVNTATVHITRGQVEIGDGNPANDSSTVTTPLECTTDVGIAKAVTNGQSTYRVGDVITYAITVTNTGQMVVPVAAIQVTDPDITGLTLVQPAPVAIAPGEWVTFTGTRVVTQAMAGRTVPNTATVTVPGDSDPSNNTATATFPVEAPVVPAGTPTPIATPAPTPRAALAVDKSGPAKGRVGANAVYTIRVRNTSANVATGVVVSDAIPRGMTLVGTPVVSATRAKVDALTRSLATARATARTAKGAAKVRATARVRQLTKALAQARARHAAAPAASVNVTILRGVVRWTVGDMQPGQVVTLRVTMRAAGTRSVTLCNTADAIAGNADRASDRQCTSFARVAGVVRIPPKVTG